MYVTFSYRCRRCRHQEDRLVKRSEISEPQWCNECVHPVHTASDGSGPMELCKADMVRLPAAPRTTFRFADRKLKD